MAADIRDLGGEARLWRSTLVLEISDIALETQFADQVDLQYKKILTGLKNKRRDLAALARQSQYAAAHDFLSSELGRKARNELWAAQNENLSWIDKVSGIESTFHS